MRTDGFSMEVVPVKAIGNHVPEEVWKQVSLYSQPWFLEAVASANAYYLKISDPVATGFFPFCGRKILWKWRLFQPSFCQRFQPFSIEGEVMESYWKAWFQFLETHVWKGHWPFEPPAKPIDFTLFAHHISERTNYVFPLSDSLEEMLGRWKANRRNTLRKSTQLTLRSIENEEFVRYLHQFWKDGEPAWRPTGKEIRLVKAILKHKSGLCFVVEGEAKPLAISLMLESNGRFHYLLGLSKMDGFSKEAMPFFFREFMNLKRGSGKLIDFEGSSLSGVASFFRSMGAEAESYGLWQQ